MKEVHDPFHRAVLDRVAKKGYVIEECPQCKQKSWIAEGEGMGWREQEDGEMVEYAADSCLEDRKKSIRLETFK